MTTDTFLLKLRDEIIKNNIKIIGMMKNDDRSKKLLTIYLSLRIDGKLICHYFKLTYSKLIDRSIEEIIYMIKGRG